MGHTIALGGMRISQVTSTDPHPLDAFLTGLKNGSQEAFRAVYEVVADDLVSFAYGMVSDRSTAEDIVQQTFLELVRAAPTLKGNGVSLRAWLFRSVRFGCLDEYRRRRRHPEVPVDALPERPVDGDPLDGHLDPDLDRALSALNERHRTLILLRHVVGLSGEEIAGIVGSGARATYAALGRAEKRLRTELGEVGQ